MQYELILKDWKLYTAVSINDNSVERKTEKLYKLSGYCRDVKSFEK